MGLGLSIRTCAALFTLVWTTAHARAGDVTAVIAYTSSVSSDANGPLDLVAEVNYDDARTNAPIAVVMHGFSPATGTLASVRANAQRLRDAGFFAVSVALRGRDGSDGVRDSGGVEVHDLWDAAEHVKTAFAAFVDPSNVHVTGYSGGGGNVMSALVRFPDSFRVGSAFFGMSDYGYEPATSWWYAKASAGHKVLLTADVGDPTLGDPVVTDRYHARASRLAARNNPVSEIHLFVNHDEVVCPPVHDERYLALAADATLGADAAGVPGTAGNVRLHTGGLGQWIDFNQNGQPDPGEWQDWPHHAPTANEQAAAEQWYLARLLAGRIPQPALAPHGTLYVIGWVRARPFALWLGDGQDVAAELDYALSPSAKRFELRLATLDLSKAGALTVDTADMAGKTVTVRLGGAVVGTFTGGSSYTHAGLVHDDILELTVP